MISFIDWPFQAQFDIFNESGALSTNGKHRFCCFIIDSSQRDIRLSH